MNLEHVAINVPDAKALVKFLVEHLGLRVVLSLDTPPYMHFVADDSGSMLEIYSNSAATMPDYKAVDPLNLHLAFTSADIVADRKRLLAAGATPVGEIADSPVGGARLAFFRAPDGVPFQLIQREKPLI